MIIDHDPCVLFGSVQQMTHHELDGIILAPNIAGHIRDAISVVERVLVEGINMVKRHARAVRGVRQAGIIEREASVHASNVMLLCNKCNHLTRIGFRFLADGKKVRVCRLCNEVID
jgi:large subunit ribosomal protein L24